LQILDFANKLQIQPTKQITTYISVNYKYQR